MIFHGCAARANGCDWTVVMGLDDYRSLVHIRPANGIRSWEVGRVNTISI